MGVIKPTLTLTANAATASAQAVPLSPEPSHSTL